MCLEVVLVLLSTGVTDAFVVLCGLSCQTCLVFLLPDFTLGAALLYHVSSSLARSTDDLLDEAWLDPRLEHLDEDSLYVGLSCPPLVGALGGRRKLSVELVLERGSLFLLKRTHRDSK